METPIGANGRSDRHPPTAADRFRLRPGATVLDISADQAQVVFPNYTATFTGVPVARGILALLAEFDGGSERARAAARVAAAADLQVEFVDYLIELLLTTNCLYRQSAAADGDNPVDDLNAFYAYLDDDPAVTRSALDAARLVVVAPAAEKGAWRPLLAAAGLRGEVVGVRPGSSCAAAVEEIAGRLEARPTLLAVWNFPYRLPFARRVNALAIERRVPVLFGACEGVIARIGPYVVPGNTGCLECCNARLLAHAGAAEMIAVREHRARLQERVPPPWPTHPVFHDAVQRLFLIEASQIARKAPPQTIGAFIEHAFADGVAQRRPVHRVPRCPACRPAEPPRLAWDARFPAPATESGVAG